MTTDAVPWLDRFGPEVPSLKEERAEIDRLLVESIAAARIYRDLLAHGLDEETADRRSKWSRSVVLRDSAAARARTRFAKERGWQLSSAFGLSELRGWRWTDLIANRETFISRYANYFKDPAGKPIAIVGHTHKPWNKAEAFAKRNRLRAEMLPYSWFVPGMGAVLYQKAP